MPHQLPSNLSIYSRSGAASADPATVTPALRSSTGKVTVPDPTYRARDQIALIRAVIKALVAVALLGTAIVFLWLVWYALTG